MTDLTTSLANVRDILRELPAFAEALASAAPLSLEREGPLPTGNWLVAMAEAAYLVASADRSPSEEERQQIVSGLVAVTDEKLTSSDVSVIFDAISQAVREGRPSRLFSEIGALVADTVLREAIFLVACAVAWHDGGLGKRQDLALRALGHAFAFGEGHIQSLLSKARQVL